MMPLQGFSRSMGYYPSLAYYPDKYKDTKIDITINSSVIFEIINIINAIPPNNNSIKTVNTFTLTTFPIITFFNIGTHLIQVIQSYLNTT